jgi:hypothetical protein
MCRLSAERTVFPTSQSARSHQCQSKSVGTSRAVATVGAARLAGESSSCPHRRHRRFTKKRRWPSKHSGLDARSLVGPYGCYRSSDRNCGFAFWLRRTPSRGMGNKSNQRLCSSQDSIDLCTLTAFATTRTIRQNDSEDGNLLSGSGLTDVVWLDFGLIRFV